MTHTRTIRSRNGCRRSAGRGTSLVELLVGMVLIALLMGVVYSAFAGQVRSYAAQTLLAETMTNGRTALQVMTDQILLAGYGVPTARTPSASAKIVTATASTLTFVANTRGVQGYLNAAVTQNASTLPLASTTGFQPQMQVYVTDGTKWYAGTVTAVSVNSLSVTPNTTYAFAAGAVVNPVETVTYTLANGQLTRNNRMLIDHVSALSFSYDSAQTAAIRRISVTLSVQTRAPDLYAGQPLTITLSAEVAPRNLALG